ncbi:hypothetical protein DA482_03075 [Pseudomonas fluorescens]|nr:hypothetical protein FIP59_13730 [Pseudomonas fluorescens]
MKSSSTSATKTRPRVASSKTSWPRKKNTPTTWRTFCRTCRSSHRKPHVGAGLPAMAEYQSTKISTDASPSRASPLPFFC